MAEILNITVIPTYDLKTLAVADLSTYSSQPPVVLFPTIEITVPGEGMVPLTFVPQIINVFNSTDLGLSVLGAEIDLPDGVYSFKYTIDPPLTNFVTKSIARVDKLQRKFDNAFLTLDLIECDGAIKTQSKVTLNTIYFFLQATVASVNECSLVDGAKLYYQTERMLDRFLSQNCGCPGNNYFNNFQ